MKKLNLLILLVVILFSLSCKGDNGDDPVVITPPEQAARFGIQEGHWSFFDLPEEMYQCGTLEEAYNMFDQIDDLTVKNFRFTIFWALIERTKGVYNLEQTDILIDYLKGKNLEIFISLQGGNPVYDPNEYSPHPDHSTPEYFTKWLNFVDFIVKRYGDRVSKWELANEPDLWKDDEKTEGMFWTPVPNAEDFSKYLIDTTKKIRETQPEATVISGGLTDLNGYRQFLQDCLELDYNGEKVLDHISAVGIHLYRNKPEGGFDIEPDPSYVSSFDQEIVNLRNFIDGYKQDVPIWNTESGYINWEREIGVENDNAQLKVLTRSMLVEHAAGIKGLALFRLRVNRQADIMFEGLVYENGDHLERRPAFRAFSVLSQFLGDTAAVYQSNVTKTVSGITDPIRVEIFLKHGNPVIAYWICEDINDTLQDIRYIQISIDGIENKNFTVRDILNNVDIDPGNYTESNGNITFNSLPVTDYPLILYVK